MKRYLFAVIISFLPLLLISQEALLSSGPMLGYNTMKEVQIWVQTREEAVVRIEYWTSAMKDSVLSSDPIQTKKAEAYTAHLNLETEPGTKYEYRLLINDQEVKRSYPLTFTSQGLWKWREDAPEFEFAIGSCFYSNEPVYDRPGKPYGASLEVLESIAAEEPDFMVWLGDNIYLREADWNSRTGIMHRYTHMRATPELQPLLAKTHHYAIWDDHDYGPNDSDRSFWGKETTEEAFRLFWANPNYDLTRAGGITGSFIWADCQFFLMDNRYHRSSPKIVQRHVLGKAQKHWLFDALLYSEAKYKFICIGAQFLNDQPTHDNHAEFPEERQEIINFIDKHQIKGVIFLTGDRHYSEVSRLMTNNGTIIYDITCSALTAGSENGAKELNGNRVHGTQVNTNNFAILKVTGSRDKRVVSLSYKDIQGNAIFPPFSLDFGDNKWRK
jgi:alkaline phosphatase D